MRVLKDEDRPLVKKRPVPEWVTWSMSEHTEDELRDAILNKPELVCFTYICRYSQMSDEFIENELIALSTGIFTGHPNLYNERNKALVTRILYIEPTNDRIAVQQALTNKTNADKEFINLCRTWRGPLRSKVDWWQIACYQNHLSRDFRKKYAEKFKEAKVRSDRPDGNMSAADLM